jgi:hypothetical protein
VKTSNLTEYTFLCRLRQLIITANTVHGERIQERGPPIWDSSKLGQRNIVMSTAEHIPQKDCAGNAQQQLYITARSSLQRGRRLIRQQIFEKKYVEEKEELFTGLILWPNTRRDWPTDRRL